MIGQQENINNIKYLIDNNSLPHFLLITGGRFTGKKEMVKNIINFINYEPIRVGTSIEDIRDMINNIYNTLHNKLYIIYNIEEYNYRSIEAILKICEEPPKTCYLIVTCSNENLLKDTIKNRSYHIKMVPYSYKEMIDYIKSKNNQIDDILFNIIYTPSLYEYYREDNRLENYTTFVKQFMNIHKISSGNAIKAVNYFNLSTNDNNKIDFELFINWLMAFNLKQKNNISYKSLAELCIKYKKQYYINGINRNSLITDFILHYRTLLIRSN